MTDEAASVPMPEQQLSKPNPDPSIATNDAVTRAVKAERDYVDGQLDVLRERLAGIDTATELRMNGIQDVPTQIDARIGHLRELMEEKFDSVQRQFSERDTRAEGESAANTIRVDAAFAAQKEAAAKEGEANQKAIDKSEKATAEAIDKSENANKSSAEALGGKIDDLKERVGRVESVKQGASESRAEGRSQVSTATTIIGSVVAALVLLLAGIAAVRVTQPATPPQIVTVTTPAEGTP